MLVNREQEQFMPTCHLFNADLKALVISIAENNTHNGCSKAMNEVQV